MRGQQTVVVAVLLLAAALALGYMSWGYTTSVVSDLWARAFGMHEEVIQQYKLDIVAYNAHRNSSTNDTNVCIFIVARDGYAELNVPFISLSRDSKVVATFDDSTISNNCGATVGNTPCSLCFNATLSSGSYYVTLSCDSCETTGKYIYVT